MLKVLIAEDNVILADLLEDYLVSQGFDVCGVAGTVDEGVRLADLHKPDLAVLDFRLGTEYSLKIRMLAKNRESMGILYVSGDPLTGRLNKSDGEAYLQKPYRMGDLVRALRIVHDIKIAHDKSPDSFPRGFHLLEDSVPGCRRRA